MQGKIIWNHLWEHRFSVPYPRVFPPPGDRFSAQMTENRIYDWAALKRGSPVITRLFIFATKWPFCGANWLLCGTNWLLTGTIWPRNEMTGYLSCLGYWKTLAIYHVKCHGRFLSSFWRNHGYFSWKIYLGTHTTPTSRGKRVIWDGESVPCNRTYWLDWEMMWSTSRTRDKEKMWVPDRNGNYDLPYTSRML